MFLLGFTIYGTLHFLNLGGYFLSLVGEVLTIISVNILLIALFFSSSSSSRARVIWLLVWLFLSQNSLRLSLILFTLFKNSTQQFISTILSSNSFIHSLASVSSLLNFSRVFFHFSYCVISVCSLVLLDLC